jgi:purine-binding chemotaxis protein CheW
MSEGPSLYCTFRAAGRLFGVPILDVKEVTAEAECTRIPHAPDEVLGFVNIRGNIFLALDLRKLLALTGDASTSNRHLVIFKPGVGPAFGVMVDEIQEIVTVSTDQMEAFPGADREFDDGDRAELVSQVCKLPTELLVVLEPRRFLPLIERAM